MPGIIALVDGSIYTRSVCDHAAWAAGRLGTAITLLHVLSRPPISDAAPDFSTYLDADTRDALLADLASHDEQAGRLTQRRARAILDDCSTRLTAEGAANSTPRLRQGDLLEAVQELEPQADLLVIGKRGEAADFARLHLGSNLERMVRSSVKPILVAARAFKPIHRVLVAFDGGASVMKAVGHLATSPMFAGLEVHLLAVGTPSADTERKLGEALATLRRAGLLATMQTRPGQPDEVIARAVRDEGFDLLVMGAYGHSRIRTLIIGSTTTAMIRSCLIPVMLFR